MRACVYGRLPSTLDCLLLCEAVSRLLHFSSGLLGYANDLTKEREREKGRGGGERGGGGIQREQERERERGGGGGLERQKKDDRQRWTECKTERE